ncbi:MAG: hypothetical protein NTY53_05300, partial [Kiritimatiellaeota bacterium]|nr:hypothetical protein [Kiritimatiellota bacterium]
GAAQRESRPDEHPAAEQVAGRDHQEQRGRNGDGKLPPEPDVAAGLALGGVTLRVVGAEFIISNAHYTVQLHRQGGVIRQLRAGGKVVAEGQDLYGDQEYFAIRDASRVNAASDVESAVRLWAASDGLHMSFAGQLRGDQRFALLRVPLNYRTEYIFSDAPTFKQSWAFSSEKEIKGKKAFLAMIVRRSDADAFRFEGAGQTISEGKLESSSGRHGLTEKTPDTFRLSHDGQPLWTMSDVRMPDNAECKCFVSGKQFFVTLLDGKTPVMQAKRWYEFQATWSVK